MPFQNGLLRVGSATYQRVEEELLTTVLDEHRHCISQLMELKKTDEQAEYFYCDIMCRTV